MYFKVLHFGILTMPFLVLAAAVTTIILFALTPATTLVAAAQIDGLSIGIIRTVGGGLVALQLANA